MNQELTQNEALFKIVRIFVVQYIAHARNSIFIQDNYKSAQNQAINIISTHICRLLKKLITQVKSILLMQGRTQPNCLHLLVAVKQLNLFDLDKLSTFLIDKKSKSYKFPHIFFDRTVSKVFQNDIQIANRYEKDKQLPTIRVIKTPYLFNYQNQLQCLPFRCTIDEAFNKPAQFTYKATVQKIQRQKKNAQNLVAFTRRQNRKALGLYLKNNKEEEKIKKRSKPNQKQQQKQPAFMEQQSKQLKQFAFIDFL